MRISKTLTTNQHNPHPYIVYQKDNLYRKNSIIHPTKWNHWWYIVYQKYILYKKQYNSSQIRTVLRKKNKLFTENSNLVTFWQLTLSRKIIRIQQKKTGLPSESQAQVPGFWDSIEVSNAVAVALWRGINDWAQPNSTGSLKI